jgi:hypothetical protein
MKSYIVKRKSLVMIMKSYVEKRKSLVTIRNPKSLVAEKWWKNEFFVKSQARFSQEKRRSEISPS